MRQASLRPAAVNPLVQPHVNPPIGTNPPPEENLLNQNIRTTLEVLVNQLEVDDHHDAFFIPKVGLALDAFALPTAEAEKKLCVLEERMKGMEGPNAFSLDAVDMCLVLGVKIPAKFKVYDFQKYKEISCLRTHIRSYGRKMVAYSNDEKLLMHLF